MKPNQCEMCMKGVKDYGLTAESLRDLLEYNPDTGIFTWRKINYKSKVGEIAGSRHSSGYLQVGFRRRAYLLHRLAWLYVYGESAENDVDHINGIRTDNRIENLRSVSRSVNIQNLKRAHSDNKTGLLGAWKRNSGGYVSQIMREGKRKSLGYFDTANEAHQAYLKAKREMHQGCTI